MDNTSFNNAETQQGTFTGNMPVRSIGFAEAVTNFFKKYVDFAGRATRSEFWFTYLAYILALIVLSVLRAMIPSVGAILTTVFSLGTVIPMLALAFRRLHDTGKSGAWVLISLVPLAGGIIYIVFMCKDSDQDNQYGAKIV